jgi:very-long-chain (3R)-3-hydroxyacyl-CoA dehydratase
MMDFKSIYLLAYNTISCLLWSYLTISTVSSLPGFYAEGRLGSLYAQFMPLLAGTQTLALLEVFHAALGLVRASPGATAVQIGGKNLVVWTVMEAFPGVITTQAWGTRGFLGCILAWGCSEMIRYGYFAFQLASKKTPNWLKWLRYVIIHALLKSCWD